MQFIFQAKPTIYDVSTRLKLDQEVGWIASRYRDQMKKGDIVYIWGAGDEHRRGIYGWGEITSDGAFIDSRGNYRAAVTYRKVFPRAINVGDLREHQSLRNLLILRSAMGTNFPVTDEEHTALTEVVTEKLGAGWAPPGQGAAS